MLGVRFFLFGLLCASFGRLKGKKEGYAWLIICGVFTFGVVYVLLIFFIQMLSNIFLPLFEITADPEKDPKLHRFLLTVRRLCTFYAHNAQHIFVFTLLFFQVVGFDCVDDESKHDKTCYPDMKTPLQWIRSSNPPYSYYIYYLWANLYSLNKFRESRGLSMWLTFSYTAHQQRCIKYVFDRQSLFDFEC